MNFISRIFCEFLVLMIIRQHSSKIAETIQENENLLLQVLWNRRVNE